MLAERILNDILQKIIPVLVGNYIEARMHMKDVKSDTKTYGVLVGIVKNIAKLKSKLPRQYADVIENIIAEVKEQNNLEF